MLSYNAIQRPSVKGIKKHPWVSGPLPNEYQIFDELNFRQEVNYQKRNEEELKKPHKNKKYRGPIAGGDNEDDNASDEKELSLTKQLYQYIEIPGKVTRLYLELHPELIIEKLELCYA